jgi:hypothetical protein
MYVYIYINVGEYTDCPVFDGLYEFCTTYTDIYIYIYIHMCIHKKMIVLYIQLYVCVYIH